MSDKVGAIVYAIGAMMFIIFVVCVALSALSGALFVP